MPFVSVRDGRVQSIKLEFNLVQHCNYSCAECSHFSPHLKAQQAALDTFARDLNALQKVYRVQRFRFVGGEPLLHKDILSFIRAVRRSGIAEKIEICSNGSLADRVPDEVFREIDMLSISWYPDPRCNQATIDLITSKCRTHGTVLKVEKIDRFRMMQLDAPIADPALVKQVFRSCQIAHSWYCQTFNDGYFYLCSRPLFTGAYLKQHRPAVPQFSKVDGLSLHDEDLLERLLDYLGSERPLESCKFCLGTAGRHVPWRPLTTDERLHRQPIDRVAKEALSPLRLRYLLSWDRLERGLLKVLPSLRLSRALNLVKSSTVRD